MQQYFIQPILKPEQQIELSDERIKHHLLKVMRATPQTSFELVDGAHQPFLVTLLGQNDQDQLQIQVIKPILRQTELPVAVTLFCGLPKREKTEWITQKGTELGADQIVFFNSARSVARWNDSKALKKIDRLQQIALEAGEQSHRNRYPKIRYVPDLSGVLEIAQNLDNCLFAYEESGKEGEHAQLPETLATLTKGQSLGCLFGPEGGIADNEAKTLSQAGFLKAGLGPRILRTETAPLYLLSAVSYALEMAQD